MRIAIITSLLAIAVLGWAAPVMAQPGPPPKVSWDSLQFLVGEWVGEWVGEGGGKTVTFLSEIVPSTPRFRLVYSKAGADAVAIRFDMAPPGKPESFSPYIESVARRK